MNKLLRNRWTGWKARVLLERRGWGGGGFKLFHQFSLRKTSFHCYLNFCLVNIHTCCNQRSILSYGLLFTRKWYIMKFLFLLLLCLNLLLMMFISISISLKTSSFLENKWHVFERSNCTITVATWWSLL